MAAGSWMAAIELVLAITAGMGAGRPRGRTVHCAHAVQKSAVFHY